MSGGREVECDSGSCVMDDLEPHGEMVGDSNIECIVVVQIPGDEHLGAVLLVLIGSHFNIFLSIFRVWKKEAKTLFTWLVLVSSLSIIIPRFLAWVAGWVVSPSSSAAQVEL